MIATMYKYQESQSKKKQQSDELIPTSKNLKKNILTPFLINCKKWHLPPGHTGRPGTKMKKIIGVTIHSTGNHNKAADAEYNCRYVHKWCKNTKVSFQYCIDDKVCIELLPPNEYAYHASTKKGNTETIGIEICVADGMNWTKSHDNAAIMTAYLLRHVVGVPKGVDARPFLFTHSYWIKFGKINTKKVCPREMLVDKQPYSWDTFVAKVNKFFIG